MTERVIRVILDPSGVRRGARQAEGSLKRVESRSSRVRREFNRLKVAAGGVFAALGAREIVRLADTYQNLQNRLRLVTEGSENLRDITSELFDVSQRTRNSFEGTVELFARVARSSEELGVSQRDVLQFTENVSQAVRISGATAQEANAAIIQLGQGLASGELRGEELRSVLEQLPSLAREIAAGLGIPFGRLRAEAEAGRLTTDRVFGAILTRTEEIEAQAAGFEDTLGKAFGVLQNSAIQFVGSLDQSLGVTEALAEFVVDLAGAVDEFGGAITGTLSPTDELSREMKTLSVTAIAAGAAIGTIVDAAGLGFAAFKDLAQGVGGVGAALGQLARGNFSEAGAVVSEVFADGFDDSRRAQTAFFDNFDDRIDRASEKISGVLLPAFRELDDRSTISDVRTEPTLGDDGAEEAAEALAKLRAEQTSYLEDLLTQEEALAVAAESGRDYAEVLEDLELQSLAAGGQTEFLARALASVQAGSDAFEFDAAATIEEIRRLRAELEAAEEAQEELNAAREARTDLLADLREENEALQRAAEQGLEYAEALEQIRIEKLAQGDSEFLQEALDLTEANRQLRDQLDDSEDDIQDFLRRARENSQDVLAGFLSDPLEDGLDALPGKFAAVLQDLAAQYFASEIFKLFTSEQGGTGGSSIFGAIGGALGNFFGGAADGATVGAGDFGVVGERGPELFVAPRAGEIVPNGGMMPAVNVSAPPVVVVDSAEKARQLLNSSEGENAVLTILRNNPDAVRGVTG